MCCLHCHVYIVLRSACIARCPLMLLTVLAATSEASPRVTSEERPQWATRSPDAPSSPASPARPPKAPVQRIPPSPPPPPLPPPCWRVMLQGRQEADHGCSSIRDPDECVLRFDANGPCSWLRWHPRGGAFHCTVDKEVIACPVARAEYPSISAEAPLIAGDVGAGQIVHESGHGGGGGGHHGAVGGSGAHGGEKEGAKGLLQEPEGGPTNAHVAFLDPLQLAQEAALHQPTPQQAAPLEVPFHEGHAKHSAALAALEREKAAAALSAVHGRKDLNCTEKLIVFVSSSDGADDSFADELHRCAPSRLLMGYRGPVSPQPTAFYREWWEKESGHRCAPKAGGAHLGPHQDNVKGNATKASACDVRWGAEVFSVALFRHPYVRQLALFFRLLDGPCLNHTSAHPQPICTQHFFPPLDVSFLGIQGHVGVTKHAFSPEKHGRPPADTMRQRPRFQACLSKCVTECAHTWWGV